MLLERREAGAAILLISEDLDEILALADRIDVMYEGRIVGSFAADDRRHPRDRPADDRRRSAAARRDARRRRRRRERADDLRLEPRTDAPRWLSRALMTLAALVFALVLSGADHRGSSAATRSARIVPHPRARRSAASASSRDTLVKATPLILTGLACSLAFRMRLWNIGAEGQFLLGAWGASAVVLAPAPAGRHAGDRRHPGDDAGRRARRRRCGASSRASCGRGSGSTRSSPRLMLNYIALFWIQFWVFGPWSEGGFQQTEPFPPEACAAAPDRLRRRTFPVLGGLTVHLGLIFGIVAAAIMWVALERTRWGYEIRLIGDSPRAARYAGIDIERKIIVVFVISGALAGLGGMSEVTGVVHRLQDRISPGYGFTAIIIAYLARFGPFRVIVASILFGALILAGREIQPSGVPAMIQGIILFSLIGSDVLIRYRVRFDRRLATA